MRIAFNRCTIDHQHINNIIKTIMGQCIDINYIYIYNKIYVYLVMATTVAATTAASSWCGVYIYIQQQMTWGRVRIRQRTVVYRMAHKDRNLSDPCSVIGRCKHRFTYCMHRPFQFCVFFRAIREFASIFTIFNIIFYHFSHFCLTAHSRAPCVSEMMRNNAQFALLQCASTH